MVNTFLVSDRILPHQKDHTYSVRGDYEYADSSEIVHVEIKYFRFLRDAVGFFNLMMKMHEGRETA